MSSLEDFENLLQSTDKPVFVLFGADFCSPCKILKKPFAEESKNNTKAVFVIVDMEASQDIGIKYDITRIPVVIAFLKGEIKDKFNGADVDKFKLFVAKNTA